MKYGGSNGGNMFRTFEVTGNGIRRRTLRRIAAKIVDMLENVQRRGTRIFGNALKEEVENVLPQAAEACDCDPDEVRVIEA